MRAINQNDRGNPGLFKSFMKLLRERVARDNQACVTINGNGGLNFRVHSVNFKQGGTDLRERPFINNDDP